MRLISCSPSNSLLSIIFALTEKSKSELRSIVSPFSTVLPVIVNVAEFSSMGSRVVKPTPLSCVPWMIPSEPRGMPMKLKACISVLVFCSLSCIGYAQNKEVIQLIPFDKPEGEFGHLGFKIAASWMDGTLEMRFPETLDSEEGMHFIDHDRADMQPLSKINRCKNGQRYN